MNEIYYKDKEWVAYIRRMSSGLGIEYSDQWFKDYKELIGRGTRRDDWDYLMESMRENVSIDIIRTGVNYVIIFAPKDFIVKNREDKSKQYQYDIEKSFASKLGILIDSDELHHIKLDENDVYLNTNSENFFYHIPDKTRIQIPFLKDIRKVNEKDVAFAKCLYDICDKYNRIKINDRVKKNFSIRTLSNGHNLNMEDTIQLANIFSNTPYNFIIGSNMKMAEYILSKEDTNIIIYNTYKENSNDILLDMKDGLSSEKNINAVLNYFEKSLKVIKDEMDRQINHPDVVSLEKAYAAGRLWEALGKNKEDFTDEEFENLEKAALGNRKIKKGWEKQIQEMNNAIDKMRELKLKESNIQIENDDKQTVIDNKERDSKNDAHSVIEKSSKYEELNSMPKRVVSIRGIQDEKIQIKPGQILNLTEDDFNYLVTNYGDSIQEIKMTDEDWIELAKKETLICRKRIAIAEKASGNRFNSNYTGVIDKLNGEQFDVSEYKGRNIRDVWQSSSFAKRS